MGKPIQQGKKPPYFRECPICHREFGSRSLEIHMSRCLERHKSSSDQETDSNGNNKKATKSPLKIKGFNGSPVKKASLMKQKSSVTASVTSDDDDEVETSLSDELSHSWPSKKAVGSQVMMKAAANPRNKVRRPNLSKSGMGVVTKARRKRTKKDRLAHEQISSGDEDSRPKTATLKRPHILDESLKDKVDMTLTKKEFLAAVKLCTDAAVQRGHPNMRVKATSVNKGHNKGFQSTVNSNSSSPYMTKIIGKIKKKVSGNSNETKANIKELRPNTTKLERPSHANLDLPQINVKSGPQIVISKSLSRHLKLKNKIKKTIEETKKEPEIRINLLGKQTSKPKQALNLAPKDKVPEPCKSCGRSDFPERLHTHHDNNNKNQSPSKVVKSKPWLSPKSNNGSRPRALSLDCASGVVEPLALTAATAENNTTTEQLGKNTLVGSQQQNKKQEKQMQKSVKGSMVSLRVVDISDELTDMEMSNNESSEEKGVTVTEVNVAATKRQQQNNNKDSRMSIDDSSSANESSSETPAASKPSRNLKNLKRPPPPSNQTSLINKANLIKNLETSSQVVPELIEELDNNNILGLVTCSVCGKQFGKNSIKFHLRQCQKKQQILKDRQEAEIAAAAGKKAQTQQQQADEQDAEEPAVPYIHEAIWEAHVQQLIPCSNCGRTFFPDRIKVHQKSCKGLSVKVANGTTSSPSPLGLSSLPNSVPTSTVTTTTNTSSTNMNSTSLDLLMMNDSPSLMRRTLHHQDDTVIATASNYEESMLKQIQPTSIKKTVE